MGVEDRGDWSAGRTGPQLIPPIQQLSTESNHPSLIHLRRSFSSSPLSSSPRSTFSPPAPLRLTSTTKSPTSQLAAELADLNLADPNPTQTVYPDPPSPSTTASLTSRGKAFLRSLHSSEGGLKSGKKLLPCEGVTPTGTSPGAITPGWEQVTKEEIEQGQIQSTMDSGYIEHPEVKVDRLDKVNRKANSSE